MPSVGGPSLCTEPSGPHAVSPEFSAAYEAALACELSATCDAPGAFEFTPGSRLSLVKRATVLPTEEQRRTLPLHAKRVPPLRLNSVRNFMNEDTQRRFDALWGTFSKVSNPTDALPRLRLPLKDAAALTAADCVRPLGPASALDLTTYNIIEYFSVVETRPAGERLRPIMWPKRLLMQSGYISAFELRSVGRYRELAREEAAVAFDLSASFWQLLLPPDARFILIDDNGDAHLLLRMPYGMDVAAEIMQIVVCTLAGHSEYSVAGRWDGPDPVVHIDNAGLFATSAVCDRWRDMFTAACRECGVTLNKEEANTVSQCLTFVGIRYDLAATSVALKPGFNAPPPLGEVASVTGIEHFYGKCLYGAAVLGVELWRYLFALKWYRRLLAACARGSVRRADTLRVPPVVQRQAEELRAIVVRNDPCPLGTQAPIDENHDSPPDAVVATDATPAGFGGVLMIPGEMPQAFGGSWPAHVRHCLKDINDAETLAAFVALRRFAELLRGKRVLLLIDNTSTISRVLRAARGDRHLEPSRVASEILNLGTHGGFKIRVEYIASARNPADALSRQRPVDVSLAADILNESLERKGTRTQINPSRACGQRRACG